MSILQNWWFGYIEEVYNLEDALVVAGFLNSFIRHADVVKIANIAQIVNVIAPILTRGDEMLIQSIYYPLAMMSQRCAGIALQTAVNGPTYTGATNGEVAFVDASGIWSGRSPHVLLTNRHQTDTVTIHIHLADGTISGLESAELLTGPEAQAANSYEEPNLIRAQAFDQVGMGNGRATFELPPLSVFAATFVIG